MIDLSTDDGLRAALREIATWETRPADVHVHELVAAPATQHVRRWPALAAAALLLIAVVAGVTLVRRGPTARPAAAQGHWSTMAPAPIPARFKPASVWTGTELLVWGGYDASGEARTDGAMYDPVTDTWRTIADFPFQHWRRTAPVAVSGLYSEAAVYGAWVGHEALFVVADPVAEWAWDIVAYDPETDAWRIVYRARFDQLADDSLVATEGDGPVDGVSAVAAHDGKLVIVGWASKLGVFGSTSFDPNSGSWEPFRTLPGSGEIYGMQLQSQVVDGHMVVMRTGSQWIGLWGYVIDLASDRSIAVHAPPGDDVPDSWGLDGSLAADVRFVGRLTDTHGQAQRVAYALDVHTGAWAAAAAPPSGPVEDSFAAQLVATPYGDLWLGGRDVDDGTIGGLHSSMGHVASDPTMTRWATLPKAPIDLQRMQFVTVWTGAEVIVWGGDDGTQPFGDGARYSLP